jgi:hypothetical protein
MFGRWCATDLDFRRMEHASHWRSVNDDPVANPPCTNISGFAVIGFFRLLLSWELPNPATF